MSRLAKLIWLGAAILLATPVFAEASGDIVVRTATLPAQRVWVGQKVALQVDVLAAGGWARASLPDFDIDGAYSLPQASEGVRLAETIDGVSYSGQRYEVLIYPQSGGRLRIPAITFDVEVTRFGADAGTTVIPSTTAAVTLEVAVPPGAEEVSGLLATTTLEATQSWRPEADSFRVGDAVKRVVAVTAADVPGMAFTPFTPATIAGVSIYPASPTVSDRFDRGVLSGSRVEAVTYVFEAPGAVSIPARTISWWNLTSEQLETIELPGLEVQVLPAVNGARRGLGSLMLWLGVVVSLAFALLAWRRRLTLLSLYTSWREARRNSERAYFKRFEQAAVSGDARATLVALMRWLDRTQPAPARLDLFLDEFGDEHVQAEARKLQSAACATDCRRYDAAGISRALLAARRRWCGRQQAATQRPELPPLNAGT